MSKQEKDKENSQIDSIKEDSSEHNVFGAVAGIIGCENSEIDNVTVEFKDKKRKHFFAVEEYILKSAEDFLDKLSGDKKSEKESKEKKEPTHITRTSEYLKKVLKLCRIEYDGWPYDLYSYKFFERILDKVKKGKNGFALCDIFGMLTPEDRELLEEIELCFLNNRIADKGCSDTCSYYDQNDLLNHTKDVFEKYKVYMIDLEEKELSEREFLRSIDYQINRVFDRMVKNTSRLGRLGITTNFLWM